MSLSLSRTPFKRLTKQLLQATFGYRSYLYWFSLYKIRTLAKDPNEKIIFQFRDLIKDGSLILDIGANLGFIAYHLAQKPGSSVLAFEPIPDNVAVLRRVLADKKLTNVTVCPYAVGESNGEVEMEVPVVDHVPMQGLSRVLGEGEKSEGNRFKVPLKRLDEVEEIRRSGQRVGGIKMDVEGYEYFALRGAEGILRKDKPVICVELWENENRTTVLDYLSGFGYVPYIQGDDKLQRLSDFKAKIDTNNFICIAE